MNAVISGRAGTALLINEDFLQSFDVDDPDTLVPRRQSEIPFLFGDAGDLQFLENVDSGQVKKQLELASNSSLALDLTLILLDEELSTELRTETAADLEELFADSRVVESLESILYAKPLPKIADLEGALECCSHGKASSTRTLLESLREHQTAIREVSLVWESIPETIFDGSEQKTEFQRTAIREGLYRKLAVARSDAGKVNQFLFTSLSNNSVRKLPNHRNVLQRWIEPFRQQTTLPELTPEVYQEDERDIPEKKVKHRQRPSLNRGQILENVQSQKDKITQYMQRRDLTRTRALIEELIEYQLQNGKPEHAVKSLCDLAITAKNLGNYSLQLELTERSVSVRPDDGWAWAQHGDALLISGRYNDALKAYEHSLDFGGSIVAKTGRAEVLKALGKLNEALAAYDSAIADHPEEVVAKNGRAEVLKALGRLDDTLAAYDSVISNHPENVVAKTGRAEVLKALGKLNDALADYDSVIAEHPEDGVVKKGRAEVLKALGRLDEALAAYDSVIAEHPEDVIAKNGRAEVLKALGKLNEALVAYDSVIAEHPEEVVAKNGRAEVHKALGKLDDALADYDSAISNHPENAVAKNGRAEVLKALGKLDDALAAYNEVITIHPKNVIARNGRSCILAALKRFEEALESLPEENPATEEDWIGYHIRGMIMLRMGKLDEAVRIFDEGVNRSPWASTKEHFRNALAIASLKQRDFVKASQVLEQVTAPALQPQANLLRLHSFGEMGNHEKALEVYTDLQSNPAAFAQELTDELHRRYVLNEEPRHDDDWVFYKEVDVLLLGGTSYSSASYYS